MNAQDFRNLQEAYNQVYQVDEDWKPVNVPKVQSRMGNLEGRLSSVSNDRFSSNTPEYARYQRTADVVAQSTRNPNKPFQKPTPDPGGMKIKPGGGVTSSPERNSQWQPFSSRLPVAATKPEKQGPRFADLRGSATPGSSTPASGAKPSGGGMGGARGSGSNPSVPKPAPRPVPKPNPRSISGSSAPRPGRGSTSNWMTDRMGEFTSALNRLSTPTKPTKSSKPTKGGRGGGSTAQGVGSSSGTGRYTPGASQGYGISGIKLADSYDLYDIILSHLLDEGYAETPKAAEAIMVNMGEEWRENILEMDDFVAGGGNAKMKETGMTKDQVVALGKKNLANVAKKQTPQQPQSSSQSSQAPASENPKVAYGQLISKPGQPKRYADSGTVTAKHKFHAYNASQNRADNIASWYGLNRNDPATKSNLKKWADTNYRQNMAMDTNDPNYDPTKTSYPEFTPRKKT